MRPCPDFASYTLSFALQLKKSRKNLRLSASSRLTGAKRDSFSRLCYRRRWPRLACWPPRSWLSRQSTRSALGQRKYLPICRIRGFPTSTNLDSKLAVRALMWSTNNGIPRSSCICLLITYQGAPLARRIQLYCSICRLWTWVRAAVLNAVHA